MMYILIHPTLTGADTIPILKFMTVFYTFFRAIFKYFI